MTSQLKQRLDRAQMRKAFDRAARRYDESAVLQQEVGRRLLELRLPEAVDPVGLGHLGGIACVFVEVVVIDHLHLAGVPCRGSGESGPPAIRLPAHAREDRPLEPLSR